MFQVSARKLLSHFQLVSTKLPPRVCCPTKQPAVQIKANVAVLLRLTVTKSQLEVSKWCLPICHKAQCLVDPACFCDPVWSGMCPKSQDACGEFLHGACL